MPNKPLRIAHLVRHVKNLRFIVGPGPESQGAREFIEKDMPGILSLNRALFVPCFESEDANAKPFLTVHHYGANADHRDISYKTREEILQILNEFMDDALGGALERTEFATKYEWSGPPDIVDAYEDDLYIKYWLQTSGQNSAVEASEKEFVFARWKNVPLQDRPTRGDIDLPYTERDIL
uniref:Uncharacterized protein n=1 Tax=Percolomonas cosmopolitus TaxID=63605 RepID=A0A7S1KQG0_9EUKA